MTFRVTAILLAAACITACGGSGYSTSTAPSPTPTPAPAGSTTVTIPMGASIQTTTAFGANPLTVATGSTVSWLNSDTITHTSSADGNQWSSGDIPPGDRFNFTFTSAGRFTYHCQIHPNMTGTIIVQ